MSGMLPRDIYKFGLLTGSTPASASGDPSSKTPGLWFSETARRRLFPLPSMLSEVMPIMASPPTLTLSKSSGVSAATPAAGGTGYAVNDNITLTGGTFVTAAVLKVTSVSSGAVTGVAIIGPGAYTVTPANPVAQGSTTGAGTGATFTLTFNAGVASTSANGVTWSRGGGTFRYTGNGPSDVTTGYYGNTSGNGTAFITEWRSDEAHFDIRLVGLNSIYMLFVEVNGQWQRVSSAGFSTDSSGAPYLMTVDWSGVYAPRAYKLFGVNSAFGGLITGSSGSVWSPTEARKPLVWWFGDSYTFGTDASNPATTGCMIVGAMLGLDVIPDGIGGTGWNSTGASLPQTRIANKLVPLTFAPQYIVLDLGYNDAGGNMTTLSTNFTASVQAIQTAFPNAKIIVKGPATPLGATTNLDTVRTTIMGLCTTLNLSFVDVRNWVNSTNSSRYTFSDNTHPNGDAGYEFVAARTAQAMLPLL